jgi:glycosyltransferase involved in cell wall biosynthesis
MALAPAKPAVAAARESSPESADLGYHVAFFTNTSRPHVGGVANSVDLYQRYLGQLGDRVIVYAPEYRGAADDSDTIRRLPSIRNFNDTDFSLPLPISFKPIMDFSDEAFDVVHVHHPFLLGEVGMRMARQHRLPLVFTYHTQYEQYTHYVPMSKETADRTIVRHAAEFCNLCDLVIAPTRDMEKMLRGRGVTSRIEVLPTGIEMERCAQGDRARLRRELGLAPDAPILVHVGRLAQEKNLAYLVRACLLALREEPRAHLVIAGDGKIREDLERLAAEAGEAGRRVHFLGVRTGLDLIDVYCAGNLFVFTSKTETQGMVVAEALSTGMPAIALDADGIRDIVRDGENGRLLPGGAGEAEFARAVLDALNDPEALVRWHAGALATARELDMPLLARRLHELYASLKLLPNRALKHESMSFGLIRNFFETVWEDLENWFLRA